MLNPVPDDEDQNSGFLINQAPEGLDQMLNSDLPKPVDPSAASYVSTNA